MTCGGFFFLSSVSSFRKEYFDQRLNLAQAAITSLMAPDRHPSAGSAEASILENSGVFSIALRRNGGSEMIFPPRESGAISQTYDLRDTGALMFATGTLTTLLRREDRIVRIIGTMPEGEDFEIEITIAEGPLARSIADYASRVFFLSLTISFIAGGAVFVATRKLIVQPMARVTSHMVAFEEDPENAPLIEMSASRIPEIRLAEDALHSMQSEVKAALRQKSRLADLGAAVSKISHDLRNMLASAQLLADRLEHSPDPAVTRVGKKLITSLDRAVSLCAATLQHGNVEEAAPEARSIQLHPMVRDICEIVQPDGAQVRFVNEVPASLSILVDPDHLFRILVNLARNACQAIESTGREGQVVISAFGNGAFTIISVSDSGPGMPEKALKNLFLPFRGGARRGGAGLGLAIAAELSALNKGTLELMNTGEDGVEFRLTLPRRA